MTIGTNVAVQFSGTVFDAQVLAGSTTVQLCILCGVSGTGVYPVMVNSSGVIINSI